MNSERSGAGARSGSLDGFLQGIQLRALRMAQFATGDREEALDLVQDAMLSFVHRYRSKPEDQWPPLFHRTLDNRIKDFYRRKAVRAPWRIRLFSRDDECAEDPIQAAPDPADPRPERDAGDREFGHALDTALRALPHRQRQAFLLRSWEGLSVADTAQAMGCSDGSVKTHLSRAMQALRDALGDHR